MTSDPRPDWRTAGWPIPVTTAFDFADFEVVATIGAVSGVYATSLGLGRSFTAGFTALARGEVPQMTEQLAEARHHALGRVVAEAQRHGGNGLLGVRFDSNDVGQGGRRRDPLLRNRRRSGFEATGVIVRGSVG